MIWNIGQDIFNVNTLLINLFLKLLNTIFLPIIYIEVVDISAILNLNFYLKVNKVLKYILFLNIYINITIFKIIINKIIKANNIININKNNIGSVHID